MECNIDIDTKDLSSGDEEKKRLRSCWKKTFRVGEKGFNAVVWGIIETGRFEKMAF